MPTFNDPGNESIWKYCGKKEKMLVTRLLTTLGKKTYKNVGKGENAGHQHFFHFYNVFCTIMDKLVHLSSANVQGKTFVVWYKVKHM